MNKKPHRVVVKVGSSTLLAHEHYLEHLAKEISLLWDEGVQVLMVSSGAVATGMRQLGLERRPLGLSQVQALAALGQAELMGHYMAAFSEHGRHCAQILFTHEDLAKRKHFLNLRRTLMELLDWGVVPIVNENDTVATSELRFGDNDRLASALATVIDANLVILLSDIDALYDKNPMSHDDALPIREVRVIDESIRKMAESAGGPLGTGGMISKIEAAKLSVEAGIPLVIAKGEEPKILREIIQGQPTGTRFLPDKKVDRKRHWIAFLGKIKGSVQVDNGAKKALLEKSASLLPVGILAVEGSFLAGDPVQICDLEGRVIGKGLIAYDAEQLQAIKGHAWNLAEGEDSEKRMDTAIHRNHMLLYKAFKAQKGKKSEA